MVGTGRFYHDDAIVRHAPGRNLAFRDARPDGRDYDNLVTFDVIEKPSRIQYRHGDANEPAQFRTVVTFEALNDNRTRITLHATFPSAEERDRVVRDYGAAKGAEQTLSRLADYVGQMT